MENRHEKQERSVFLIGIIGTNGTGKSVTARAIAERWRKTRPHGDIMAYDPTNAFSGIANKFIYPHEDWCEQALELNNALLILDEVRILHPQAVSKAKFLELMSMRRDQSIDIIYIVHNPALVLSVLTYFTTRYYLFYTQALEGSFKNKMPNYALCLGASDFINDYVRELIRVTGEKGEYPKFPYVVVDNDTEEITAINISRQYLIGDRSGTKGYKRGTESELLNL